MEFVCSINLILPRRANQYNKCKCSVKHRPMRVTINMQAHGIPKTPPNAVCVNSKSLQRRAMLILRCLCIQPLPHYAVSSPSVCPVWYKIDSPVTESTRALDFDRVDDLRRSAPSLGFLLFARRSAGTSSSSDSSTVKRSGLGSRHEWR